MKIIKAIALSVFLTLFTTSLLYNVNFEFRIYRYIIFTISYCIYSYLFFKYSKISLKKAFIIVFSPPLIIDFSVIFTAPNLILLRFPFATSFTLLGILMGRLIIRARWSLIALFTLIIITYSYVSYKYLIPLILNKISKNENDKLEVNPKFYNSNFITSKNDTIILTSILQKINSIDLYFVGCVPCQKKEKLYSRLAYPLNGIYFSSIFICDGSITEFKTFSKSQKDTSLIYLYDFENNIKKYIKKPFGYPFEFIIKDKNIIDFYLGYNEEAQEIILKERIELINHLKYE